MYWSATALSFKEAVTTIKYMKKFSLIKMLNLLAAPGVNENLWLVLMTTVVPSMAIIVMCLPIL